MAFDAFMNFFRGADLGLSHFLAQFIGIFLIILSLYVFFKHEHFREVLEEVEKSSARQFNWATGFIFWGLLLILVHQHWVWNWPVLITIIGWFLFILGLARLFFPETIFKPQLRLFEGSVSYYAASIWLVVGVILTLWGFHTFQGP